MEEITELFSVRLANAENDVIRLSVVTALNTFLDTKQNLKPAILPSALLKNLLDILEQKCDGHQHGDKDNFLMHKTFETSKQEDVTVVRKLLTQMTLQCFYELSRHPEIFREFVFSHQSLILSHLADFCFSGRSKCGINTNFRFCPNFTKCIKKYVDSKDNRIKVKVISERCDLLTDLSKLKHYISFYDKEIAEYFDLICKENSEMLCVSIVEEDCLHLLKGQQVAWGQNHSLSSPKSEKDDCNSGMKKQKSNGDKVRGVKKITTYNAIVTKVLNGNLLWLNIGDKSLQSLELIRLNLEQRKDNLKNYRCRKNDIVAADVDDGTSSLQLLRGKVLDVGHTTVTVFALDFGDVYQIPDSSIFRLPAEVDVSVVPPQATLAYLSDVSPTPVDCSLVEIALTAMCNFCRWLDMAKTFDELGLVPSLPVLISCEDAVTAFRATNLATNLAKKLSYTFKEYPGHWSSIMLSALDLLNKLVQKYIDSGGRLSPTSPTVSANNADCSTPIICVSSMKKSTSDSTPPKLGAETQMCSCACCSTRQSEKKHKVNSHTLIVSLLRLLTNCLCRNKVMKEIFYIQNGLETVLLCQRLMVKRFAVRTNVQMLLNNFVHVGSSGRERFEFPRGSLNIGPMGPSDNNNVLSSYCADDDDDTDEGTDDDNEDDCIAKGSDEDEEDWEDLEDSDIQEDCSDVSKRQEKKPSYYIKDSTYPFVKDPSYEMVQALDWSSRSSLVITICGMLNSGRKGVICVGVDKEGKVLGEKTTHDMRDDLRLGIDEVMSHLVPNLMYFQIEVQFVPVLESPPVNDVLDLGVDDSLSVIEIVCHPIHQVIYTDKTGKCFYRSGRKTFPVNEQDIRHLLILDEEGKYREETLELERKLNDLTTCSSPNPKS